MPGPPSNMPGPPAPIARATTKTALELQTGIISILVDKPEGKSLTAKSRLPSLSTKVKNDDAVNHEYIEPVQQPESSDSSSEDSYVDDSDGSDAPVYDEHTGNPQDTGNALDPNADIESQAPSGSESDSNQLTMTERKRQYKLKHRRDINLHGSRLVYDLYQQWQATLETKNEYIDEDNYLAADKTKLKLKDTRFKLVREIERGKSANKSSNPSCFCSEQRECIL